MRRDDLRYRRGPAGSDSLDCFVLDCSGSMLQQGRLALAKGLLATWFAEAARARQPVALVCYGADRAYTAFAPAVPRWWNERWIQPIGGGGGTPLGQGLQVAERHLRRAWRQRPGLLTRLWLLTDGRCPEAVAPMAASQITIVELGKAGPASGGARRLAARWQATYLDQQALGLSLLP